MDSYNVSLDCSKKLLEEYKAKEDEQFSAAELALNTYERLNQPHLRNGLAALDPSIFRYVLHRSFYPHHHHVPFPRYYHPLDMHDACW